MRTYDDAFSGQKIYPGKVRSNTLYRNSDLGAMGERICAEFNDKSTNLYAANHEILQRQSHLSKPFRTIAFSPLRTGD